MRNCAGFKASRPVGANREPPHFEQTGRMRQVSEKEMFLTFLTLFYRVLFSEDYSEEVWVPPRRTEMNARDEGLELKERLILIESMIAEGRRGTKSYSWTFILWGLAYYVAIAWSTWGFGWAMWGHNVLAWPVTMACASVLTWVVALRKYKSSNRPSTTLVRAISSIWIAMGISMFTLLLSLGLSGRSDQQM